MLVPLDKCAAEHRSLSSEISHLLKELLVIMIDLKWCSASGKKRVVSGIHKRCVCLQACMEGWVQL